MKANIITWEKTFKTLIISKKCNLIVVEPYDDIGDHEGELKACYSCQLANSFKVRNLKVQNGSQEETLSIPKATNCRTKLM